MKKKILALTCILGIMLGMTGCQENYHVAIRRGAIRNNSFIYYDEDYEVEGYEWDGTDLIIHFSNDEERSK